MNKTFEDLVKEITDALEERQKCRDRIQQLLEMKEISWDVERRFIRYSDGLEVGFYNIYRPTSSQVILSLKSMKQRIEINKNLYVAKRLRMVKSLEIRYGNKRVPNDRSAYTYFAISPVNYLFSDSQIAFIVTCKEWKNLKEEMRIEIDVEKEKGLSVLMPTILRRLAEGRKNCMWEAVKWKRLTERMINDFTPELVAREI